jgi:8-oxo-dGTP diphosphatase
MPVNHKVAALPPPVHDRHEDEPIGPWDGEPVNAEPHKHSELVWADPGDLPPDTVDYTAAIIKAAERGDNFALNGW